MEVDWMKIRRRIWKFEGIKEDGEGRAEWEEDNRRNFRGEKDAEL